MCRSCTKLYVSNEKISDYINNNLYVEIDHFPIQISHRIIAAKKIYLFPHVNVISSREDPFGLNLGGFYYESVTSPFLLWKTYLNILSLIVFNSCYRHILSQFVPNSSYGTCRDFTVCAPKNCRGIVPNKIKAIFYKDLVFCNRIATLSCALFNLYVIIETFNSYQRVIDFFRVLLT